MNNQPVSERRFIRINLYLTQLLLLAVALTLSLYVHGVEQTIDYFHLPDSMTLLWASLFAALIAGGAILMEHVLPKDWMNDGGMNRLVFSHLSKLEIVIVCLMVGIAEEWLFRGVIQPFLGNGWTSGLFTLLHVRYLRKPLLIIGVYAISYMLGYLFEWSNGLLAPMLAHTLIDLVQAFYLKRMIEQERRM